MTKSTLLLKYILEGNESSEIIMLLCNTLDFKQLKKRLIDEYVIYVTEELELDKNSKPKVV